VPPFRFDALQEVQTDWVFVVDRVEVADVVVAPGRDVIKQFLGQVAVRVEHAEAAAGLDVSED
jgi:hypothetical protein